MRDWSAGKLRVDASLIRRMRTQKASQARRLPPGATDAVEEYLAVLDDAAFVLPAMGAQVRLTTDPQRDDGAHVAGVLYLFHQYISMSTTDHR